MKNHINYKKFNAFLIREGNVMEPETNLICICNSVNVRSFKWDVATKYDAP